MKFAQDESTILMKYKALTGQRADETEIRNQTEMPTYPGGVTATIAYCQPLTMHQEHPATKSLNTLVQNLK